MIDRINAPETYPGSRAERTARGVALLSLDIVRPVYPCLAVGVRDPAPFQALLREAIERNRRDFVQESGTVPDLLRQSRSTFERHGQGQDAKALHRWMASTFVSGPADYRAYSVLQDMLSRASRDRELTSELGLPEALLDDIFDTMSKRRATACLNENYIEIDDAPLSDWDAEVCTRLRFYEENRDPYVTLHLTCNWIDFHEVVKLIVGRTTPAQRSAIVGRTEKAARRISRIQSSDRLLPLDALLIDNA